MWMLGLVAFAAAVAALVVVPRARVARQLDRALAAPDVDRALRALPHVSDERIPALAVLATTVRAQQRAQVHALFLQLDQAALALAEIDEAALPADLRPGLASLRALVCFAGASWADGVAHARAGMRAASTLAVGGGLRCAVADAVGRTFLDRPDPADHDLLARGLRRLDGADRLLAAWGLTVIGGPEAPAATRFLARRAPHAPLLRRRPGAGHGASTARSAASSSER